MKADQVGRLLRGHYSFTRRIVPLLNSLPEKVVSANSVNEFKNRLDKFWGNHPMRGLITFVLDRKDTLDTYVRPSSPRQLVLLRSFVVLDSSLPNIYALQISSSSKLNTNKVDIEH